jgi:hypothetical protein
LGTKVKEEMNIKNERKLNFNQFKLREACHHSNQNLSFYHPLSSSANGPCLGSGR